VIALVVLLVGLPLLIVVLAVRLSSPGPVLYRQRRLGLDGRAFELLKFRSMACAGADVCFRLRPGSAPGGVEGVDRRTTVGRILRCTSLDELPQLINVLRGDMSLVGPRPERPEFVQLFADEIPGYADRHRMRGGITGLAQVRGLRGQTSIARRAAVDIDFIERWSLLLDAKVLVPTVAAVFRAADQGSGARARLPGCPRALPSGCKGS
jgi:lipopolysaccharide/colanic/teichoic acid biosynthesis glycosyltransferase